MNKILEPKFTDSDGKLTKRQKTMIVIAVVFVGLFFSVFILFPKSLERILIKILTPKIK